MTTPIRSILVAEFWPGASGRGLATGLRAAGWLVDEFDIQRFLGSGPSIPARIEARLRRRHHERALVAALLARAAQLDVQVVVAMKGIGLSPDAIAQLRAAGLFLANYYPDYHFNDIPIETVALYDLVATTKSFQVEMLAAHMPAERVTFVPHGYLPEFHHAMIGGSAIEQDVDLLYIGNASAEKAALLIPVAEALPNLCMRVIGVGWRKLARGTALERTLVGHARSGDYFAPEIARAKINLAFHMGCDRVTGFADLVSTRTFEIPACGGFMLHIDNDEVRSLFDMPGEMDTFTDASDLIAKIRHWLANPVEREAVAARGRARAVPAYSYTERGKAIALLVEQRLPPRQTFV